LGKYSGRARETDISLSKQISSESVFNISPVENDKNAVIKVASQASGTEKSQKAKFFK
jgi:hypothetical protein